MLLEDWGRLEELFRRALDRPPEERRAWLRKEEDDEALIAEVEALLEADEAGSERLDQAVRERMRLLAREAPRVGACLGPYRLEQELGRGGTSTVYLGVRRTGDREERVAVKLLAPGLPGADVQRRFAREVAILERLDHPGIARLLDTATTDDGRPYLVMEYVEGEPLIRYCQARELEVEARLELFLAVCEAVQFAHRSLVIHRDLKPANILVTAQGRPKLLDFGVARLLERHPGADPTVTVARLLTPSYASPEQIRGEALSTATDVFSLGVVLYQLLTDLHPFRQPEDTTDRVQRRILTADPPWPSQRLRREGRAGRRRARRLSGDLDRVVMKALEAEPERRYGTVEQLADDLRRHLGGRPVSARPATAAYRARKFLRRHRTGTAAALILVLLLSAFAVITALQERRTAEARTRAEQERHKAEQALSLMVDLFEVTDPDRVSGETVTAREILDRATRRVETELADQPRVQATLLEAIGRVYLQLGLPERARSPLETALALHRNEPEADLGGLAQTLETLGHLHQDSGEVLEAVGAYREALEVRRELLGPEHPKVATALNHLGDALEDSGDSAAAEPFYRQALEMRRRLFGEHHEAVAESLNQLGLLHHQRRELDRAEPLYRRALEMRREILGPQHPEVAVSLNNLAALQQARGRPAAAEGLFREAVAIQETHRGRSHPETLASLQNLAMALKDLGRHDEAEELLLEVLAVEEERFGEELPNRATNLYHLGLVRREAGDPEAAEEYFRRASELYRRVLPPDHPWPSFSLLALGELLLGRGRPQDAEAPLAESVHLRQAAYGPDNPLTAEAENALGACLLALGREEERAEELLRSSLAVLERAFGTEDRRTRRARGRLEEL